MVSYSIVSVFLIVATSFVSASANYEGYGTVYTLTSPSSGNCNFMNWPSDATTKYAALNAAQWEETMNCGRCAEVSCTDASCAGQSSEIVYIMDQCPGCEYGDLDLSPDVFESITGQSYTKLSIEWKFVDCPISNNVQYCLKTGSSEFWVAVQPANFVSGVQSLSINGQETSVIDSAYYFLIDGSGESVADLSSVSISLTGVNGEVIEDTISMTADECTEGSSQFSTNGYTTQTTTTSKPSTTSAPITAAPTSTPTPSTAAPTTSPPTTAPVTEAPVTKAPATEAPTSPPATEAPTSPPTSAPVTEAPVTKAPATEAPTSPPAPEAPTSSPVTEAPTSPPDTEAPTTTSPSTEAPTMTPVTKSPTSNPTAAVPTSTPISTPAIQSKSASSDASRSSLASADEDASVLTKSTSTATVSSNSTSSTTDQVSESTEEPSTSTTQVSSIESSTTSTPTSTPAATEASVREEASDSGGLHSTAAIVGLVAAVCVALGATIGVAVVVQKKRKLLEERKNMEDRDSLASYASIRTPRSEVPVMHSAV